MEPTNRCNSPGTSNIIDLISSVNTLIDNLSEPAAAAAAADDAASSLIDKSAADINRQLEQLEKLFTRQKSHRRPANQRSNRRRQQSVAVVQGACSRSPCSNCTASNCNAESNSRRPARRSGGRRHRRYHSASATSSSDSSYSRCCIINSSCLPTKHAEEGGSGGGVGQLTATHEALENTSNRSKHRTAVRRRPMPQKTEHVDFGYLKAGLQAGGLESKEPGCGDRVVQMEQMIGKLNTQVDKLKSKCERQLRADTSGCGLSHRLKDDIRRVQARVSYLYSLLQQTLGTARSTKAVGCRHTGSATEQARDPLTDLKCKYERSLLYSRFDVNWPFLHIIAPRPISWEPVCCDEID